MKNRTIEKISVHYYQVPLERVMVDALHGDHTHFELIVTRIFLEDGSEGMGYTYTGGKGGKAIYTMIQADLVPILIGQDSSCIEKLWLDMQTHIHYVGRGGIEAFAIAALDIALWDLRAKYARTPLWRLLGGANSQVKAYAGAIDLNYSIKELQENNISYLKQGFNAVKIKLGKPTIEEDIARVEAVRETIGRDTVFIVNLMIGLLTPPVGMVLFVLSGVSKVPMEKIAKAILPYVIGCVVVLFLITYIPSLVIWLPNLIFDK